MAKGKATGEFSFKSTSLRVSPGPGGSTVIESTMEGTASGFGAVIATAAFVGRKSGTFSFCGAAYMDNGETSTASGSGTYESIGKHRWRTDSLVTTSEGQSIIGEGEIDFATRSWKGTMFEKV